MKTSVNLSYLAQSFLRWKMFQIKVVEKIGTHILFSITSVENRAVCEITWKNVERGTPRMTLWRMRIVRLQRDRLCNTYCFSPATVVAGTRLNVMLLRTLPVLFMVFFSPPRKCRYGYKIIPQPFSFISCLIIQWSYVESSLEFCNPPHWSLRPVNDCSGTSWIHRSIYSSGALQFVIYLQSPDLFRKQVSFPGPH